MKSSRNIISLIGIYSVPATLSLLLYSGSVIALESKPHKIGSTLVTSTLTSALGYGDNVFRSSDDELGSAYFSFKPQVSAVRETQEQRFSLGYSGDGLAFFESSGDNFFSNTFSADYTRNINPISQFTIGAALVDGSSVRGIGVTEGANSDIEGATDFTQKDFSLGYAIGSTKVGPSLNLLYQSTDLEFDNFLEINRGRDYSLDVLTARIGYQYSVATNFFLDLSHRDFDYDRALSNSFAELDNTEVGIHAGIRWNINRLISGEVSVGSTDKSFDNFQDPSSLLTWNAQIQWTPSARDIVILESYSKPTEQAGSGLFQEIEQTSISWTRQLSRKLSVSSGISLGKVDLDQAGRSDDFDSFNLGFRYNSSRYSEWSLSFEREDKTSNLPEFDFDVNRVFLSYAVSI